MRATSVLVALAVGSVAIAKQEPLQVFLHPTPSGSSPFSPPTLSADQAKAVLSHHLGEAISETDDLPSDESLWSHLVGSWGDERVVSEKDKPRVVIIEGGVSPQEVLPTSIDRSPAFYLKEGKSTRALLAPYLQRASHFLEGILNSLPALPERLKDLFDFAESRASAALEKELASLSALVDSLPWYDTAKYSSPWEAISISSLKYLDKSDEVWETGRKTVQASLESMTQPNSPPLLIIIVPDQSVGMAKRGLSDLFDFVPFLDDAVETSGDPSDPDEEDPTPSDPDSDEPTPSDPAEEDPEPSEPAETPKNRTAEACYTSEQSCKDSTTCFGRGSCALKGKNGDDECWGCKCNSGYAGVSCQKEDYSTAFVIIVLSSLLLLGTLGGSIALLYTVGETELPSTLNLAIGNPKRD